MNRTNESQSRIEHRGDRVGARHAVPLFDGKLVAARYIAPSSARASKLKASSQKGRP